jgi:pimeloyl-ACP methyl ester carboxylesterase
MRSKFESIRRIGGIGSPVLFLHSPEDVVIPIREGRRLYDAAPGDKQFVEVRGGHVHASEVDEMVFKAAIAQFLARHGLTAPAPANGATPAGNTSRFPPETPATP